MNSDSFEEHYTQMNDDELEQVLADRKDLVPDAAAALDMEVQRRKLQPAKPPEWHFDPDRGSGYHSLDEDTIYRSLEWQRRFLDRFWYWLAFLPAVANLLSARYAWRSSEDLATSVAWVFVVIAWRLFVKLRIGAFTCPECTQRFGSGAHCYFCGFPRTKCRDR